MKTKKLKLARTALRLGLIALAIGIVSFILAMSLIQNPLETTLYLDVLFFGGILLAGLGMLSTFLVSLTFLPGIIKYATKNTQQHLAQNNKSYRTAVSGIFYGIGLLFVALFKVWAFLVSSGENTKSSGGETDNIWSPDYYWSPYGNDHLSYCIWHDDYESEMREARRDDSFV